MHYFKIRLHLNSAVDLGPQGCNGRKLSPITAAWCIVAGWRTDIVQAFSGQASLQIVATARRAEWLFWSYSWDHVGECVHAIAFRQWVKALLGVAGGME